MTDYESLVTAARDLLALRRERLVTLLEPDRDFETEVQLLAQELGAIERAPPAERAASGEAFAELVEIFGSAEEVWAQYPTAAGLLLLLRARGGRENVVSTARLVRKRP